MKNKNKKIQKRIQQSQQMISTVKMGIRTVSIARNFLRIRQVTPLWNSNNSKLQLLLGRQLAVEILPGLSHTVHLQETAQAMNVARTL